MAQAMLKNCPVCGKISVEKYRPFCSVRCANIDLGGWLGEKYRVPTEEAPGQTIKIEED
ncbi:MAG: DNA gyrase inhibitor YacG [Alphaproteobacteria bacterium]|nr:DNA gyrase inhibitor YacG [Alphaproteobacteria bacterium]